MESKEEKIWLVVEVLKKDGTTGKAFSATLEDFEKLMNMATPMKAKFIVQRVL